MSRCRQLLAMIDHATPVRVVARPTGALQALHLMYTACVPGCSKLLPFQARRMNPMLCHHCHHDQKLLLSCRHRSQTAQGLAVPCFTLAPAWMVHLPFRQELSPQMRTAGKRMGSKQRLLAGPQGDIFSPVTRPHCSCLASWQPSRLQLWATRLAAQRRAGPSRLLAMKTHQCPCSRRHQSVCMRATQRTVTMQAVV